MKAHVYGGNPPDGEKTCVAPAANVRLAGEMTRSGSTPTTVEEELPAESVRRITSIHPAFWKAV